MGRSLVMLVLVMAVLWPSRPARAADSRRTIATLLDRGAPVGKRTAAARALGRSGDPGAIPALIQALGSRDERFTEATVAALRALRAGPLLAAQLSAAETPPEDRRLAARGLRYLKDPTTVPALLDGLRIADRDVRVESILGLGLLVAPEATVPLLSLVQYDPDAQVRFHAAQALGDLGGPEAASVLEARLRAEPDGTVKLALRQSLGKLRRRLVPTGIWRPRR